jgi:hypothetical protein
MFTRDSLLGGLPARRASTILFTIESRTAALVRSNRVNRASYIGERTAAEREQAFLSAMAGGREAIDVRIEEIEGSPTAANWSPKRRCPCGDRPAAWVEVPVHERSAPGIRLPWPG